MIDLENVPQLIEGDISVYYIKRNRAPLLLLMPLEQFER
jgi:hypothetical protein